MTGRCVRPGTPETREPSLWLARLFAGIVLRAVRGSFLTFQFDRMYSRLRLPAGRDGLWAACLLAFCTLVAVGAPLANLPTLEVGATGLVAACAGYLAGRVVASLAVSASPESAPDPAIETRREGTPPKASR